jgi:hypothetical protein
LRCRWNAGRFRPHAPGDAIQAWSFAGRQFVNYLPGRIEHFQLQLTKKMSCLLVVSNDRGVWRIIANKYGVAVGPATIAFYALLYRTGRNKGCLLRKKLGG